MENISYNFDLAQDTFFNWAFT